MQYTNPVIFCDYSDPDVIKAGEYYYMVASSFNYVPGVPVLRSKNLVEWELVNYVIRMLPFERFNGKVCAGEGAWAPSIRYNNGKFYCLIPIYDEGIFVSEALSPEGEWSPLRPLIRGSGIIDPCPVWTDDGCYVVVAFARSRAGFNSALGLYRVTPDLTACLSETYKIIYDGHNNNPIIEGPKFYKRNGYFYILAPAGSVKSGWQVALRSQNIFGPYESKVILMQGDSLVNGPHQGALVTGPDGKDWFLHFQDMRAYGRVVHLQPVTWQNGWPVCGHIKYDGIAGTPVERGEYPADLNCPNDVNVTPYARKFWQFPCNPARGWFGEGNALLCVPDPSPLSRLASVATVKLAHKEFVAKLTARIANFGEGDEFGFGMLGKKYAYISVDGGKVNIVSFNGQEEKVTPICSATEEVNLEIRGRHVAPFGLSCTFGINGSFVALPCDISAGEWTGARFALFARNKQNITGNAFARIVSFTVE